MQQRFRIVSCFLCESILWVLCGSCSSTFQVPLIMYLFFVDFLSTVPFAISFCFLIKSISSKQKLHMDVSHWDQNAFFRFQLIFNFLTLSLYLAVPSCAYIQFHIFVDSVSEYWWGWQHPCRLARVGKWANPFDSSLESIYNEWISFPCEINRHRWEDTR